MFYVTVDITVTVTQLNTLSLLECYSLRLVKLSTFHRGREVEYLQLSQDSNILQ